MNKDLFEKILNNIHSELQGLSVLLTKEKQLLADSAFESITEIADQKKQIITNIEVDDSRLKAMLHKTDTANHSESVYDIISETLPGCAQLWLEIEKLLKTCKDNNAINGIILTTNRRQIRESLAILQGQTNEVLTYGATGESVIVKSSINSPFFV